MYERNVHIGSFVLHNMETMDFFHLRGACRGRDNNVMAITISLTAVNWSVPGLQQPGEEDIILIGHLSTHKPIRGVSGSESMYIND